MATPDLDRALEQTLADARLSRGEKCALKSLLKETGLNDCRRSTIRRRAFELARQCANDSQSAAVLGWLEDVVKLLDAQPASRVAATEAYFTPGDDCLGRITRLLRGAKRKIDICMFTITDNRITAAILDAHCRAVAVRIITDDEKVYDYGSDIEELQHAGVPVRVDRSESHMHHKFAVFDERALLTGSYNWTHGAAANNMENFIISHEPPLIEQFMATFEDLWQKLSKVVS